MTQEYFQAFLSEHKNTPIDELVSSIKQDATLFNWIKKDFEINATKQNEAVMNGESNDDTWWDISSPDSLDYWIYFRIEEWN